MRLMATALRPSRVEFLDAQNRADREAWLDLWNRWPEREVMAHPDYVRLFARPADRVVAATVRLEGGGILYPVILRPLAEEPWTQPGEQAWDLTTAYGYGGPFGWNVTEEEARDFWVRFDAWAAGEGVIASFARLSLFPQLLLPFNGSVETRSFNIVRRLDQTEADIWADYSHKVRKNVNHAMKLGLSVEADTAGVRVDEFLEIYTATMKRRGASSGYYHPRRFFESIIRDLGGHFCFFHSVLQGRVISTELVLLSANRAYSFLGGSLEEAFRLRAADLLKHEMFRWCRRAGKSEFILGGGFRVADGIYQFKKSFAPRGEVAYRVGERVYDTLAVAQLLDERRRYEQARGSDWNPALGFFPLYRA